MTEREKCIQKIKDDVKEKLIDEIATIKNPEYKRVLKNIIIQGMIKLLEDEVVLKCREEDVSYVESITSECSSEFKAFMLQETGRDYATKLTVDRTKCITKQDGGQYGGVILSSTDRRIICINTMLSRLNQCFDELLPDIRRTLFPNH